MASHYYVPGPALVAVGTGASRALQYLGVTRDGVHVREDLFRRPITSDVSGPEMPHEILLLGKMVTASMVITKFDPAVMAALMARYFTGLAGAIEANGIGTLLLAEGGYLPLVVKSPYQAAKTLYASNLPGLHIPQAFVDQSHGYNLSTSEQGHELTFTGITLMNDSALTGALWDTNVSGFPVIS